MYQETVEIFGQGFTGFFPLKKVFSPTPWSGLSFSKIVDYPETQLKVNFPKLWITILQTPIGGHQPMLYFKSQTTEKYSIAICYTTIAINHCHHLSLDLDPDQYDEESHTHLHHHHRSANLSLKPDPDHLGEESPGQRPPLLLPPSPAGCSNVHLTIIIIIILIILILIIIILTIATQIIVILIAIILIVILIIFGGDCNHLSGSSCLKLFNGSGKSSSLFQTEKHWHHNHCHYHNHHYHHHHCHCHHHTST